MSYLLSLPTDTVQLDVLRSYPDTGRLMHGYHEVLLRGPSPLSVAEHEILDVTAGGYLAGAGAGWGSQPRVLKAVPVR